MKRLRLSHEKEWLLNQINRIPNKTYLLFDFPGQAELYSGIVFMFARMIQAMETPMEFRLCSPERARSMIYFKIEYD